MKKSLILVLLLLGLVLISGCIKKDVSIRPVIDKWNEIIENKNEAFGNFSLHVEGEAPEINGNGEDFIALKIWAKDYAKYYKTQMEVRQANLSRLESKYNEENNLITDFFGLVTQLKNPQAKLYGEEIANNLREYNIKSIACVRKLLENCRLIVIENDKAFSNLETKFTIYQLKIDAGTYDENDYITILTEGTNIQNELDTKINELWQYPSECTDAETYIKKAEDGINQLESLQ